MKEKISALLVHDQPEPLRALEHALRSQSIKTLRARNYQEAMRVLGQENPPHLVFTDTALPDGTWADVLALASRGRQPANVIVVGRLVDTRFYIEVIEKGAFDFIVPPFAASDLTHVVRCASDSVVSHREALARAQKSPQSALLPPFIAHGTALTAGGPRVG
jgi:DNA-binding NtrC family response regulator